MMLFHSIFQQINRIGEWILRALYLQVLWIAFTIIGLVLFGVVPATTAVFVVLRQSMIEDETGSMTRIFLTAYKENMIKSNVLGMIVAFVGLFLYFDIKIVRLEIPFYPLYIALLFLAILFLLIMLYIFPVFVHYQLSKLQYIKQSLLIALARPLETIGMMAIIIALYYVFYLLPILIIFLGVPLIADPIMRISLHAFNRLAKKEKQMRTASN